MYYKIMIAVVVIFYPTIYYYPNCFYSFLSFSLSLDYVYDQ